MLAVKTTVLCFSKNIFPSILRSIKEGMLQIWDALRKCQELLLLQAKSSSGSSAKTGGNGNSGLNGNYMLPVVSEAISKFINEMEAVLTQLASHNDKVCFVLDTIFTKYRLYLVCMKTWKERFLYQQLFQWK